MKKNILLITIFYQIIAFAQCPTPTNPFVITNLSPTACYAFFLRSVCDVSGQPSVVSQWSAIASSNC